jgi:NADPH-dependent 2,4-dienoyl-CoA reductase/sulfur reductase-like enzyme
VVIIGASFIGSETASSLKLKYKEDLNVHMISSDEFPLERAFGKEIGALVKSEHEKGGVVLHMNMKVKEIKGD